MTRTISPTSKTAPKQAKKLSLRKQTLKDLTVRGTGPKGGQKSNSGTPACAG